LIFFLELFFAEPSFDIITSSIRVYNFKSLLPAVLDDPEPIRKAIILHTDHELMKFLVIPLDAESDGQL
jgi:hypothetical protein